MTYFLRADFTAGVSVMGLGSEREQDSNLRCNWLLSRLPYFLILKFTISFFVFFDFDFFCFGVTTSTAL